MNNMQLLSPIVKIIHENSESKIYKDKILVIMEDTDSPVTRKYVEKLFESIIDKQHVDFDDIPLTKGDITKYKGYSRMVEVLDIVNKLAKEHNSNNVIEATETVQTTIKYLQLHSDSYRKAFSYDNDILILQYNCVVYAAVQATSAILYSYVDYIKNPNSDKYEIIFTNNKYKANGLYLSQLKQFNDVVKSENYRKYLNSLLDKDVEGFLGSTTSIGIATVVVISLAIVPIMREMVFYSYMLRGKLSDVLAQQAYFLDLNRANVMSSNLSPVKKQDVLRRQKKTAQSLITMSEKIRVSHVLAKDGGDKLLKSENKMLSLDNVKREVNSSPLELL